MQYQPTVDVRPASDGPSDATGSLSRRGILTALVASAVVGGLLPGLSPPRSEAAAGKPLCVLLPALRPAGALRAFVETFEAGQGPDLEDRATLMGRLLAAIGERAPEVAAGKTDTARLAYAIRGAIQADFAAGRTHRVDGWLFAETEVALAVTAIELAEAC